MPYQPPVLVFSKLICQKIQEQRDKGNDPYPGVLVIESQPLPIMSEPNKGHPFAKYIGNHL